MFSAIPPRNDETIDVDLHPPSLKKLLRYLHVAYARELPSLRDTCLRLFDIVDLAEFYVWCKKYQFEKFAKAAIATIPSLDLKGKPWAKDLACVLVLAQDADDIQLGRTAIESTSTCPGPFLDFMEAARTRLSPSWLEALQWGVIRIESEGLSSTARGSNNFAERLSELFAEELQVGPTAFIPSVR